MRDVDGKHIYKALESHKKKTLKNVYQDYYAVGVFLVVMFALFLVWLFFSERYYLIQYNKTHRSPDEYCLQIQNFPPDLNSNELKAYILELFDKLAEDYGMRGNPLIDIAVAHTHDFLKYFKRGEANNLKLQRTMILFKQEYERFWGSELPNEIIIDDVREELREELKKEICETQKKMRPRKLVHILDTIDNYHFNGKLLKDRMNGLQKKQTIKAVFVTFQRIADKKNFEKILRWKFGHLLMKISLTKKNQMILSGQHMYVERPPLPININWKSFGYSDNEKFVRRFLSGTVYVLLYVISKINFLRFSQIKLQLSFRNS